MKSIFLAVKCFVRSVLKMSKVKVWLISSQCNFIRNFGIVEVFADCVRFLLYIILMCLIGVEEKRALFRVRCLGKKLKKNRCEAVFFDNFSVFYRMSLASTLIPTSFNSLTKSNFHLPALSNGTKITPL